MPFKKANLFKFNKVFLSIETDLMDNLTEISNLLSRINDPDLIEDFFHQILTPAEINTLDKRWELLKMLDRGISQRFIARQLHISLCKITRGSRELKKNNSAIKKLLSMLRNSS